MSADLDQVGQVDEGEEFDVLLPISTPSVPVAGTHVARMRGDQVAFADSLSGFLATGGDLSAPLGMAVEASSLGELADILNSVGGARVQSIDPL